MMEPYDRPGAYLVDHPNAARAIRKRVAALVSVAAVAALVAVPTAGARHITPGGVKEYHAPGASGPALRL